MSSIKTLTYRVWRILEGGDIPDDSRFRYAEIRDHVRSAIAFALKQNYFESRNDEDGYKYGDDSITQTTGVETLLDDVSGLTYLELSEVSVSIPASNRLLSISEINPYSKTARRFIPVRSEERFLGQLQPDIPCVVLYERNGAKVTFYNDLVEPGEKLRVAQKYTVSQDDDTELGLPQEYELQVVDSVSRILDREIRMADRANDGTPLQVNRI
jgi:hypothetical protein